VPRNVKMQLVFISDKKKEIQ